MSEAMESVWQMYGHGIGWGLGVGIIVALFNAWKV